jgi:hybrid cluster-associated redox disulfide protein
MQQGMGCLGCAAARFETLAQGAAAHGIDLEPLLAALNKAVEE